MARILIAEDEPDIRNLIEFTLKFGGHEVFAFSNGSDAVEQTPKLKPDLILLDVRMPRLTGYEACQALKKDPQTRNIPVVFLSAKGQEAEVDEGLSMGAVAYILKPFAPDHLLNQLKKIIAEHVSGAAVKEKPLPETRPLTEAGKKPEAEASTGPGQDDAKKTAVSPQPTDDKKANEGSGAEEPAPAASPKEADAGKPGSADPTPRPPEA